MAEVIAIMGQSGTGKSTSLRNLDPKETFIINCLGKKLPFKGSSKIYNKENKNYLDADNYKVISDTLKFIDSAKHIKNVVIDDSTYILTNEFMNRAQEKGYEKFTQLAVHFKEILDSAKGLREDIKVFVMGHTEFDEDGQYKLKTVGKLLDSQWNVAGLFSILLMTYVETTAEGNKYSFVTNKMGPYAAKSPMGMFDSLLIPNDLQIVSQKINEYYN
jgi:nicotinamide riboside kinase